MKMTAKKLAYILEHYSMNKTADIAQTVGLSYGHVRYIAEQHGLKKDPAFIRQFRLYGESENSKKHRFQKGQRAWNKGQPYPTKGRAADTQFKPGQLPHNTKQGPGTIVQRKDGPYICLQLGNWKRLAIHTWEQAHGPVPSGYVVRQKDGNRNNCNLDNLELISRADNMALNTIHRLPEEVKRMKLLVGAFKRKLSEHEQQQQHQ